MSELGRSKYNTERSSKPVHSFAYKEDSGPVQVNHGMQDSKSLAEMWIGFEEGSYLRLIDRCITHL